MIAIGSEGVSVSAPLLWGCNVNVLIFITIISFVDDAVISYAKHAILVVWAIRTLDQVHMWCQFHALVNYETRRQSYSMLGNFTKQSLHCTKRIVVVWVPHVYVR